MNELTLPLILQLAGVGVIVAEVILPSGGLLSVLAMGLFGYSLYVVFHEFSRGVFMSFILADIVMIPLLVILSFRMLARSPVTLNTALKREGGVSSQAPELAGFLGKEGRALSDLRPSGTALIDGRRTDVVSRGEFIEKGSHLVVLAVTGNQVIVKQITE